MKKENVAKSGYDIRYEQLFQTLEEYRSYPERDLRKQIIDTAVASYRKLAGNDEIKLRCCSIIEDKYMKPQTVSNRVLAAKYFINQRTVPKSVHEGMKGLMVLVYGIDGILWGDGTIGETSELPISCQ